MTKIVVENSHGGILFAFRINKFYEKKNAEGTNFSL